MIPLVLVLCAALPVRASEGSTAESAVLAESLLEKGEQATCASPRWR